MLVTRYCRGTQNVSCARNRFPPLIIRHAVWLYSCQSVRRWSVTFGLSYASGLKQLRPRPDARWHLDEMFVSINGKRLYL